MLLEWILLSLFAILTRRCHIYIYIWTAKEMQIANKKASIPAICISLAFSLSISSVPFLGSFKRQQGEKRWTYAGYGLLGAPAAVNQQCVRNRSSPTYKEIQSDYTTVFVCLSVCQVGGSVGLASSSDDDDEFHCISFPQDDAMQKVKFLMFYDVVDYCIWRTLLASVTESQPTGETVSHKRVHG